MADLNTGKKGAPRVDLTAMVDLGFLLITFFMLTTTMGKPLAMDIIKPAKLKEPLKQPPELKKSKTITVLSSDADKVYWYVGSDEASDVTVDSCDFSKEGLRKVLQTRQQVVEQQWGSKDSLRLILKAMPESKVRNYINILDETRVVGIRTSIDAPLDKLDTLIMRQTGSIK